VPRAGCTFQTTSKCLSNSDKGMDMPKGYFFVELEIVDPAVYEAYLAAVPDIISAHGGRILVRGGDPQLLDGTVPHCRRVLSSSIALRP
jgi:hypothetical protein